MILRLCPTNYRYLSKCKYILGYIYLYVSKHITYFWHWYTSLKQASKNVKEVVLERISAWVIFRCLCIQDTYMYCACQGCISDDSPAAYNVDSDLGFLRVRSFLQKRCVFVSSILTSRSLSDNWNVPLYILDRLRSKPNLFLLMY